MNAELATREWLRGNAPAVLGVVVTPDRIDFGYAGANPGTRVVLFRGGGGPDAAVDVDSALIIFSCFGTSRGAAAELGDALVRDLRRLRPRVGQPLQWAEVQSGPTWAPDEAAHANYSVTALVTAKMTAAAV